MQIHSIIPCSLANGPGERFVIWFQGCNLGCAGCANPSTHAPEGGESRFINELDWHFLHANEEHGGRLGLTLTGGEPFQQNQSDLQRLLQGIMGPSVPSPVSLGIFTGYTQPELLRLALRNVATWWVLSRTDVLISGRYDRTKRINKPLRSSSNQELVFLSDRYSMTDIEQVAPAEFHINEDDGTIIQTGTGA